VIAKHQPMRDEAYLALVRALPSVISGQLGCEAHHPIGQRFSQRKCSDLAAFPLLPAEHRDLHHGAGGWKGWEDRHGNQWMFAMRTLLHAIASGYQFKSTTTEPQRHSWPTRKLARKPSERHSLTSSKILPRA
jgi:hypothetical protein